MHRLHLQNALLLYHASRFRMYSQSAHGSSLGGADLRRFDLNLLVALHALLAFRNVTRAGQYVGLSQPAMSGELRRLRRLFGDELLVRIGRDYHLTPLARELVEPVGQVIS